MARESGAVVARLPQWPSAAPVDLIDLAPDNPELSQPVGAAPPLLYVPGTEHPVGVAAPSGPIVVVYHRTDRTPGRYLEAALRRSGATVQRAETLDWAEVEPGTSAVVFVESPLPEIKVTGTNPGIPILFWVHHGEHHLDVNMRLQLRYGADLILLAHSWHLSHRFIGRVERFPFAVAPEINVDPILWRERRWDVGFVGSLTGGRYDRRARILEELKTALGPDRVMITQGVTPEEQAKVYANSRIVINDGGTRHLPITMRVFEALGAGALLLTDPAPGLDVLLTPGVHYAEIEDPIADQAVHLLKSEGEQIAATGFEEAHRHHTYDRRVQDLFRVIESMRGAKVKLPALEQPRGIAGLVDDVVDLQRVLVHGDRKLAKRLPDREVWETPTALDRAKPGAFDVTVINRPADPVTIDRLIRAARKAIVLAPRAPAAARQIVSDIHPDAIFTDHPEGTVATFGTAGYRLPPEHPACGAKGTG